MRDLKIESKMTDTNPQNIFEIHAAELNHPAWDEPIICRVEVDLPAWLAQLAGGQGWEVYSEAEEENCVSFAMRQGANQAGNKGVNKAAQTTPRLAEVTLYHNGYAIVDVDGSALFDGSLTSGENNYAHLTYYHADSGEKITLN